MSLGKYHLPPIARDNLNASRLLRALDYTTLAPRGALIIAAPPTKLAHIPLLECPNEKLGEGSRRKRPTNPEADSVAEDPVVGRAR
jgi:hypothetical protein